MLTESFPGERASASSDNVAKHGEKKIEKKKLRAIRERVFNLDSP